MNEDASEDWSLEILALKAGMSRTSYAYQFKELMQFTPGKYIEAIRLNLARRLIVNGTRLVQNK
jgi:AraC-like DNA-binding protein